MLSDDSPLRRLPVGLDPKQALFFDGIRHAQELIDLAYPRLTQALTEFALREVESPKPGEFTAPFLDAWAIVDAIDRLRALVRHIPGVQLQTRPDGEPGFLERTSAIRSLRNVADHLAQRADYVVARNSSALGYLGWVTVLDDSRILSCMIMPGTLASKAKLLPLVNPAGMQLLGRTDVVTLTAGAFTASLSDAVRDSSRAVGQLEVGLGAWIRARGLENNRMPADFLLALTMELVDDPAQNGSSEDQRLG